MKKSVKKIVALFPYLFITLPAFAQLAVPKGMETLADSIYSIFSSNLIRIILAIFLCGAAIAYAFNKDNEKIKRSALTIGIAAAILISAKEIVNAVWKASGGTN